MHQTRPAGAGEGDVGALQEACALTRHVEAALAGPMTGEALDAIAAAIWRAHGAGELTEASAVRLDGLARARRARMTGRGRGLARPAPRRPMRPRSPDRAAAIARRRRVAASGAVPAELAEHFTQGQIAALSVVGREAVRSRPWCDWAMDRIAALAGVSRTVVREALRLAQTLGLLRVRERRHRGARSETNVVTVPPGAWRRWLKRGPKGVLEPRTRGGGCRKAKAAYTEELRKDVVVAGEAGKKGEVVPRSPEGSTRGKRDRAKNGKARSAAVLHRSELPEQVNGAVLGGVNGRSIA